MRERDREREREKERERGGDVYVYGVCMFLRVCVFLNARLYIVA